MTEAYSTLSIRIPKALHDQLKQEAKSVGLNLTQVVTPLLEARHDRRADRPNSDLVALLTAERTTARFGDETILEEILRRLISMQLISVHQLTSKMSTEEARSYIAKVDEKVLGVVSQRAVNGH